MQEKLTKAAIIENLHNKLGYNRAEIHMVIDELFEEIKDGLKDSRIIELRGFGTFEVRVRKGRAKGSLRFVSAGEKLSFCLSDKQFAVIYSPSEGRAAVMTDGKFTEETASLSAVFYVEQI